MPKLKSLLKKNLLSVACKNEKIDKIVQDYMTRTRRSFLGSQDEADLHGKLMRFYRPFMPFYKNAFPGKLCSRDVRQRLAFLQEHTLSPALDIGMQDGFFVRELNKSGIATIGIDNVSQLVKYARRKDPSGTYLCCYAENLPFGDELFRTAICSHVLEHVLSPAKILREMHRILAPGGHAIVIVPYELGLEPTHLREYDRDSLLVMVSQFFRVTEYYPQIGAGHGCIAEKLNG